MGDGLLLESGTHTELLRKRGTYTRLVEAQRLREGGSAVDSETKHEAGMDKKIPADRKPTRPSLANDVDQVNVGASNTPEKDHSLRYIIKRIAPLCREQRYNYILAVSLAAGK